MIGSSLFFSKPPSAVTLLPGFLMAVGILGSWLAGPACQAQLRSELLDKYALEQWDRIPLSSEDPTIGLRLCAQPHTDPCSVIAEMLLSLPSADRSPKSLESELVKWQEAPWPTQTVIEPPRRSTISGRPAVEVATQGEHSIHIHKLVVHETIVFQIGDRFARCQGWSEPAEHLAFSRAMHDFCATYDISTLKNE